MAHISFLKPFALQAHPSHTRNSPKTHTKQLQIAFKSHSAPFRGASRAVRRLRRRRSDFVGADALLEVDELGIAEHLLSGEDWLLTLNFDSKSVEIQAKWLRFVAFVSPNESRRYVLKPKAAERRGKRFREAGHAAPRGLPVKLALVAAYGGAIESLQVMLCMRTGIIML